MAEKAEVTLARHDERLGHAEGDIVALKAAFEAHKNRLNAIIVLLISNLVGLLFLIANKVWMP